MNKRRFNGSIGITDAGSVSSHEPERKIPNRPNVVYIVLDDIGFAQLGCYGSTIETPNIDRLAAGGLRYNNFHTTAICSATRASLLTGANHHTVGISTVVDTLDGGFPNRNGYIDPQYATTAEVLKEYGYANIAVGKWHLTPFDEATVAGPFDNWPLGKGFDRFYGFMEGYTDQYHPDLVQDNERLIGYRPNKEHYHLSEDLADNAIKLLGRQHTAYPNQPFFLYFALGAGHAPHQAPKEYIDKYKGRFDKGWDAVREEWFENQKRLGITPQDAKLNARNEFVKPWDALTDDEKKVYARYMEVFAGFLDHADAQIGRVLDYLKHINVLDNTVIVLLSDNGASAEGGKNGRFNQEKSINLVEETDNVELTLPHLDELGTNEYSNPHYPVGWANAGNTPFQWYKSWVHSGGVKDPLIISYPNGISAKGEIRSQYLHVTDIAPTILDILGVQKPSHIKGVPQQEYHGISFRYTFDDAAAANRKHTQYYEQTGNRGIWHDGWKAITNHIRTDDYINETWELYHTDEDFSEAVNVADQYPNKLQELIQLWYAEAGKYGVLPLGNGPYITKTKEQLSKSASEDNTFYLHQQEFEYKHVTTPIDIAPRTIFRYRNRKVVVQTTFHKGDAGILYTAGNHYAGYVLYIQDDKLKYTYNANREKYFKVESSILPEGEIKVELQFLFLGNKAIAKLLVNGKEDGQVTIDEFIFMQETHTSLKNGFPTPVSDDFTLPFEYPKELQEVKLTAAAIAMDRETLLNEFFAID